MSYNIHNITQEVEKSLLGDVALLEKELSQTGKILKWAIVDVKNDKLIVEAVLLSH